MTSVFNFLLGIYFSKWYVWYECSYIFDSKCFDPLNPDPSHCQPGSPSKFCFLLVIDFFMVSVEWKSSWCISAHGLSTNIVYYAIYKLT